MSIPLDHILNIGGAITFAICVFVALCQPRLTIRNERRLACLTLAHAAESREPHLKGHSAKTAALVVAMAKRSWRIAPWDIWDLEASALLHLIGKVGVPLEVLSANASTSARIWVAVREYVRIGAKMLDSGDLARSVGGLKSGAATVADHREYVDGSGYPMGKRGEEISFPAKLLCVATEYVAMTSPRAYRPSNQVMSRDEAVDALRSHAGVRYDAECVELLAAVVGAPSASRLPRPRPWFARAEEAAP